MRVSAPGKVSRTMCAIFGWLGPAIDPDLAAKARDRMIHRGPDDSGMWFDSDAMVWLGHRRLAIFDVSAAGHQPMMSPSGRFIISFNGEVYNFIELRQELEVAGFNFGGTSDTEVMLAAFEHWGIEKAVERFIGMFAFALWDRHHRSLTLVRDRLGIKPVYYAHDGVNFAFASELHALDIVPWVARRLDHESVALFLRHLCVPSPRSIWQGIKKLAPGEMLTFREGRCEKHAYWSLHDVANAGHANQLKMSFNEAAEEYERLLQASVALRMRSDVPFGSFLSGGVDSSLVTAIMTQLSDRKINTFTIGFPGESNDESGYARDVANHLGTQHHELFLNSDHVPDLVAKVAALHDEPFADGSSLPTYILSEFARRHVTVALGGDGGDETFGGYPRYFWAQRIQAWQQRLGRAAPALKGVIESIPEWVWRGPLSPLDKRLGGSAGLRMRAMRLADYLTTDIAQMDQKLNSAWPNPEDVLIDAPDVNRNRYADWPQLDLAAQMMAVDQHDYLPDDILTKVDRASMAVALEARVPLLDHRLVEWSWKVPSHFKMALSGDRGKLLMREVLYRYVPAKLIERPKAGFGMPIDRWLRGPLKEWASDLLSRQSLNRHGIFKPQTVERVWQRHLAGENCLPQLWTVLMMNAWLERQAHLTPDAHA